MNDLELLRRAAGREGDERDKRPPNLRSWTGAHIGATRGDMNRLVAGELAAITSHAGKIGPGEYSANRYILTEKARRIIFAASMEHEFAKVPRAEILAAMSMVIGFDDLKLEIAKAVEKRKKTNFLLEGGPACGKSVILEAIRTVVPDSYMAFGSRTSAAGLSQVLFDQQPGVLCMDEVEKMRQDCYAVCLGLMERGEIIETKSQNVRGIKLNTLVIAACNSSVKMPKEFLSRFAFHAHFPPYTREQFVQVCSGFLSRSGECPESLAAFIGQMIFDLGLGDFRRARAVCDLMDEPTEEEVRRIIGVMLKYSEDNLNHIKRRKPFQQEKADIAQPNLFN